MEVKHLHLFSHLCSCLLLARSHSIFPRKSILQDIWYSETPCDLFYTTLICHLYSARSLRSATQGLCCLRCATDWASSACSVPLISRQRRRKEEEPWARVNNAVNKRIRAGCVCTLVLVAFRQSWQIRAHINNACLTQRAFTQEAQAGVQIMVNRTGE